MTASVENPRLAPANDCTGPLRCGHIHRADSAGRCWEAECHPTYPCPKKETAR